jgi:hypothetical protein
VRAVMVMVLGAELTKARGRKPTDS